MWVRKDYDRVWRGDYGKEIKMRYIRTFSGIIVDTEQQAKRLGMSVEEYIKTFPYSLSTKADTIEELCDVIVCNEKLFYPLTSYAKGNHFNWEEIISCSHNVCCSADYKGNAEDLYFKIYGAIWTDKGLIYVAKMNEKGELELL